jgi:DNA-directed RNA polymerase specialized sigma24 family protein
MLEQDQLAKWIVGLGPQEEGNERAREFVQASRQAWPRVLAHTRRELSNQRFDRAEITSLVLEIWEAVLRSVWKTLQDSSGAAEVKNLENYLIGAFHHRLNRHLKQKRRRDASLEFVPPQELIELSSHDSIDEDWAVRIDRAVQLKQVYAMMDEKIRKAIIAKVYGFSWSEIAKTFQIEEQNLIMRVQYAIRKIRQKIAGGRSK